MAGEFKTPSDLFNARIPSELWHYTQPEAFRGIVSSHCIWATDSSFLNDPSEVIHARSLLSKVLKDIPIESSAKEARAAVSETIEAEFTSGFLSAERSQFFISSFSESEDDLEQWRAYSNQAKGLAICFDMRTIRPPSELRSLVTFAPCIYDEAQKQELISVLISSFFEGERLISSRSGDKVWLANELATWRRVQQVYGLPEDIEGFKESIQSRFETSLNTSIHLFRADLTRLACHFKHPAYKHEREWRLVLPRLRNPKPGARPVLSRGPKNTPYVEFVFRAYKYLPITRVMLAPCCSDQSISNALLSAGYQTKVDRSTIPYRCD